MKSNLSPLAIAAVLVIANGCSGAQPNVIGTWQGTKHVAPLNGSPSYDVKLSLRVDADHTAVFTLPGPNPKSPISENGSWRIEPGSRMIVALDFGPTLVFTITGNVLVETEQHVTFHKAS